MSWQKEACVHTCLQAIPYKRPLPGGFGVCAVLQSLTTLCRQARGTSQWGINRGRETGENISSVYMQGFNNWLKMLHSKRFVFLLPSVCFGLLRVIDHQHLLWCRMLPVIFFRGHIFGNIHPNRWSFYCFLTTYWSPLFKMRHVADNYIIKGEICFHCSCVANIYIVKGKNCFSVAIYVSSAAHLGHFSHSAHSDANASAF